jgi:Ca2+:H+ antiporter
MKSKLNLPWWSLAAPVLAWILFLVKPESAGSIYSFFLAFGLIAAVIAAVHHAEVIAYKVGEPFGTLILALAVTTIEVALIVSLMLAGGESTSTLARDTVFAAVMLILTGMIGLCLLIGGARYKEQVIAQRGVGAALVTLTAITILTLVLPNYTTSAPGPVYTTAQLMFVAIISLILYLTFVMVQAVRHRDYFLSPGTVSNEEINSDPPNNTTTLASLLALFACLGAVVLIAKAISPVIEQAVDKIGAPKSLVGIIIAAIILLPEGAAAIQAARNNRLQNSLNLALGSALASIGLTIPAVAIVSVITGFPVTLGIDAKSTLLMILSLYIIMLSLGTGRTTVLQGIVLLVIFAVYLFTTIIP